MFSTFIRQRWPLRTTAALLSGYGAFSFTSAQRRSLLEELPQPRLADPEENTVNAGDRQKEIEKEAREFCTFADNSPSGNINFPMEHR
jgi:hypothetical protein